MSSRYYDSNSEGEIRPGRISEELRAALDIAENDIPIWIYRMRALGYPPGWLSKAVVDTSDIFDTDSPDGPSSGKRKNPSAEVQYDHSKLIEYPGFNTPMPPNCVDYHYFFSMPAMLEHQQLEYAKQHMSAFKPAQIPKRQRPNDSNVSNGSLEETNATTNSLEDPQSPDQPKSDDDTATTPQIKKLKADSTCQLSTEGCKLVSKGSPMPKPVERAHWRNFPRVLWGAFVFRNLPTSTGKFDTIRGLLNTIRKSKSETSFDSTRSEA